MLVYARLIPTLNNHTRMLFGLLRALRMHALALSFSLLLSLILGSSCLFRFRISSLNLLSRFESSRIRFGFRSSVFGIKFIRRVQYSYCRRIYDKLATSLKQRRNDDQPTRHSGAFRPSHS